LPAASILSFATSAQEPLEINGGPYSRLVEKDGKSLSPDQQRKEQSDLDRFVVKRQKESEHERRKRLEQLEKERETARIRARNPRSV
jgi:hypothetical protein